MSHHHSQGQRNAGALRSGTGWGAIPSREKGDAYKRPFLHLALGLYESGMSASQRAILCRVPPPAGSPK